MSFFVGSRYLRLQRTTVHPAMAVFLPLTFLLSLDPLLRAEFPRLNFPGPLIYPFLLAAALEEAVMGNILFKERASIWARLRELLLVLIVALLYLRLLDLLAGRSGPPFQWQAAYPLLLVFTQWLSSAAIHSSLREREILLRALAGKRDGALAQAFRDSSFQAVIALRSMTRVKGLILFYQGFLFCLLIASSVRGTPLGPWVQWASVLQAVFGLLSLGLINLFIQNQLLLGEGISFEPRIEQRQILFMLLMLAAAVLLVLLASRETSILPLSALLAFLEKLVRLFQIRMDPRWLEPLRNLVEERLRCYELLRSLRPVRIGPAFLLVLLVLEILRRVLVAAVVVCLILFLTAPLFSESFLQSLRELRPLTFLRRKLRGLAFACLRLFQALWNWWRSLDQKPKTRPEERSRPAIKYPGSRQKRRITLRKRFQMSRVLKAFLALLKWAEGRGVRFYPHNAPREYALRFEAAIPGSRDVLDPAVEILEEVLFSPHLVAGKRLDRYFRLIRRLRGMQPRPW